MQMPISFDKLRLTNKGGNTEHVFLESFRKYTPVVCARFMPLHQHINLFLSQVLL